MPLGVFPISERCPWNFNNKRRRERDGEGQNERERLSDEWYKLLPVGTKARFEFSKGTVWFGLEFCFAHPSALGKGRRVVCGMRNSEEHAQIYTHTTQTHTENNTGDKQGSD